MKISRLILLLCCFALLACAGSKSILEGAVQNANKETLAVSLVEHADGSASYELRSPSGLVWRIPTMRYAPGKLGVDGMNQRDFISLMQTSASNQSVVALQEHNESGINGFFVGQGRRGSLYVIDSLGRLGRHPIPDQSSLWYQTKITGLSGQGMWIGGTLFKWREIDVHKVYEGEAATNKTDD